jgi:hypothetical protein
VLLHLCDDMTHSLELIVDSLVLTFQTLGDFWVLQFSKTINFCFQLSILVDKKFYFRRLIIISNLLCKYLIVFDNFVLQFYIFLIKRFVLLVHIFIVNQQVNIFLVVSVYAWRDTKNLLFLRLLFAILTCGDRCKAL